MGNLRTAKRPKTEILMKTNHYELQEASSKAFMSDLQKAIRLTSIAAKALRNSQLCNPTQYYLNFCDVKLCATSYLLFIKRNHGLLRLLNERFIIP